MVFFADDQLILFAGLARDGSERWSTGRLQELFYLGVPFVDRDREGQLLALTKGVLHIGVEVEEKLDCRQ